MTIVGPSRGPSLMVKGNPVRALAILLLAVALAGCAAASPDGAGLRASSTTGRTPAATESQQSARCKAYVAFSHSTGDRSAAIFVMDLQGRHLTRLAPDQRRGLNQLPAFSPSGNRVAYLRVTGLFPHNDISIWTAGLDTSRSVRRVSRGPYFLPSWSPDGKRLVVAEGGASRSRLTILRLNGTLVRHLGRAADQYGTASWSPDGRRIVYDRSRNGTSAIYSMKPNGGDKRLLRDTPKNDDAPAWSPDGKHIVFTVQRITHQQGVFADSDIFIMNRNGSHVRPVLTGPARDYYPHYTGDGKQIIFQRGMDGRVYSVGVHGAGLRKVSDVEASVPSPQSSCDSTR